ncbi:hypothetical protein [Streptomyces sp. TLI_171]|uniref:hypothetical protein n=1 Tax=Streptomyces sp. TLI_171 TaxID=1938859 RepID=UPI000C18280D|nr:hypothetical protein [Streptomyces sp. TLI_171]RKE23411.1 hypothetical protein BX266_6879 [Streptomyces sp. TLI_171]
MLAESLTALAGAGASALIGAMATDLWQGARGGVVRLFGRGGEARGEAIGAQLDEDAVLIARAEPADADGIRADLLPVWRRRLLLLLEEHPDSEDELRDLVARVQDGLPAGRQVWTQSNTARDHGTVFAVQGGSLHYHQAPEGQVPPPADEDGAGGTG